VTIKADVKGRAGDIKGMRGYSRACCRRRPRARRWVAAKACAQIGGRTYHPS